MFWGNAVTPATLAEPADLATWLEVADPPDKAAATLKACSRLVLEATTTAFYDADPATGLATEARVADALRDATLIQAAAWVTLGIDPHAGGAVTPRVKSSTRLGSAQVSYADADAAAQARARATKHLVSDAVTLLVQANLIGGSPWSMG